MTTESSPIMASLDMPSDMLAWKVPKNGEPADVMSLEKVPVPLPGPGQVLIEVWSAGLNFPDALLVRGQYQEQPPLPFTPGLEACGEIVGVGPGVDRVRLGERVIGVMALPHGSLAKYAVARSQDVLAAPNNLDDASASVFHIAYQTAWFGLYRRAALRVGDVLLVHAAAGGVGVAALQLGRAAGAKVIGVVGSPEKVQPAKRMGADIVIDRSRQDVVEAVREATSGRGVDVVFDPVGGDAFQASTQLIRFEGRIVLVGFAGGTIPQIRANQVLLKNYAIYGLHWARYRDEDPDLVARAHADLTSLVDVGALAPLLSEKLQFEDAPEGIARIAAGTTIGRIAVSPP
jgi:NADPH2:quinone reductase